MRDSVSLLDQLVTLAGGRAPTLEDLEELLGIIPSRSIRELVDLVAAGDAAGAIKSSVRIHDAGIEPEELLRQLLDHLHDLMLASVCGADDALLEVTERRRETLKRQSESLPLERLVYMIRLLAVTLRDVRQLGEGRILVEVALIRLARSRDVRALADLRTDLDALVASLGGAPAAAAIDVPAAAPAPAPAASEPRSPRAEPLLPGTPPDEVASVVPPAGSSLEERWSAVLERLRESKGSVAAFLKVATPVETGEDRITLEFAKESGFHRQQLELPGNREVVEAAIRSVMGSRIRVSFMTREAAPREKAAAAPPDRQSELAAKAREDPLVQRVCDTFQGRVVHVRRDETEDVVEEEDQ